MSVPAHLRTLRFSLAFVFLATQLSVAASMNPAHIVNFGQVNANLYRGAAPTQQGLKDLNALGVKVVLDLREPGFETKREKAFTEGLGMKYINIPLDPWSAPAPAQVQAAVQLLDLATSSQPVFVHCRRGKDRTGTVVACYRIQHDGWKNLKAQEEANHYGMSWTERGMRSFISHYAPAPFGSLANSH